MATGQRRRRGRSGGDDRVDDDGGAPAILGGNGGVDDNGDGLANPAVAFPSDNDDRSGGDARLKLQRRRRREGSKR